MKKIVVSAVVLLLTAGAFALYRTSGGGASQAAPAARGTGGAPGGGGGAGGAFARPPMTVELAAASRASLTERVTIVGNLIGAATVEVVPKVSGRLQSISVRLGDPVRRGQTLARVEDEEALEQVKQAEASFAVSNATIREREADLKFAEINLERSRSLYNRQLLPRQSMDDAEARYQASSAQVDLARAQFAQARSRLEELRIGLTNTTITSPVDGFIGRRMVDPGAFVGPNSPVVSVVDIHLVRLVANVVERDLRRITPGLAADVDVDAFPDEVFKGRVARIAPVLDPATRTAEMEVEVPNGDFRLKPGMYARVRFVVDHRKDALTVPRNAIVDVEGERGVYVAQPDNTVKFQRVTTGLEEEELVEVATGLAEGTKVVTTGAGALRDGDRVLLPNARAQGDGKRQGPPAEGSPPTARQPQPARN
jgi:RND family efflux transporter MFP subunit